MIKTQLAEILSQIRLAALSSHRDANRIMLLAVSKQQSADKIREAFHAGQKQFGENYLQEALEKQQQLSDLNIEWHFIGHIQSNKTKLIAQHFHWVHSVDRLDIAKRLNDQRPSHLPLLNVCIEVNINAEKTKSGVAPETVLAFAKNMRTLKQLKLRGLMVIPEKNNADAFAKTAALQQQLIAAGFSVDTLSMGMSDDFDAAIAAGATIVRIGTKIFGKR